MVEAFFPSDCARGTFLRLPSRRPEHGGVPVLPSSVARSLRSAHQGGTTGPTGRGLPGWQGQVHGRLMLPGDGLGEKRGRDLSESSDPEGGRGPKGAGPSESAPLEPRRTTLGSTVAAGGSGQRHPEGWARTGGRESGRAPRRPLTREPVSERLESKWVGAGRRSCGRCWQEGAEPHAGPGQGPTGVELGTEWWSLGTGCRVPGREL